MSHSITYLDLPLLLGRGFTFSTLDDDYLWGTDKNGVKWHADTTGTYVSFASQMEGKLCYTSRHKLTRDKFDQLFPKD